MKLGWTVFPALALALLSPATARAAATVAVMPVSGVNLTEGQCDAIGVLFANAFASETNVVVASPLDTKPVLAEAGTALAAATKLGVFEYVELTAVQLGSKTTLSGVRFSKEGQEVFRAETTAVGLDDMSNAAARLAHALAWAQAAPRPQEALVESPPPSEPAAGPKPYPAALGVKSGVYFPVAKGRSFASLMSLQFDARIGPRSSFAEVGAGAAIPSTTASGANTIEMGGVYAEFGGGAYLSNGSIAPYLGGGVSPRIWIVSSPEGRETTGATCTVHGMAGVNFTRDNRARIYGELRVSQYVIGLSHETDDGVGSGTYYPTEFSLHIGIGW
ncbi:MAG: hypothetical protein JXP73_08405 [Deltaproteobacteria bacterium]|nr:hypothetical protein [Deltaproteobacteria bacterium]